LAPNIGPPILRYRRIPRVATGLGIICTFEKFLREALDRGELKEVLADWRQKFPGPFLYYPSRNMPARPRAFVNFIRRDSP
jgi:DNA-binding transcriptional LysR family regulator